MIRCKHCGAESYEGALFCQSCGMRLAHSKEVEKKSLSPHIFVLLILCVVLLVLAALAYPVSRILKDSKEKKEEKAFLQVLQSQGDCVKAFYGDFDGDGRKEMFGALADGSDDQHCDLWYVTKGQDPILITDSKGTLKGVIESNHHRFVVWTWAETKAESCFTASGSMPGSALGYHEDIHQEGDAVYIDGIEMIYDVDTGRFVKK